MEEVVRVLQGLRLNPVVSETELHREIALALVKAGIAHEHEVKLGPRRRIDFLTSDGVGIEVKKGKVGSAELAEQVGRYAESERVTAVVVVVERSVFEVPHEVAGKPVRYVSLSKNWGIAL